MKSFTLIFFYFLLSTNLLAQQITQYSNYIENAFYLNPAISSPLSKKVLLAYRTHWTSFEGAPTTSYVSFQSPFSLNSNSKSYSSFGSFIQNDNIGVFNNTALNFSYSYSFLINDRLRFSLGSSVGLQQIGADVTILKYFQPNDPIIDISRYSILAPNLDFGITISNDNNFIAFSSKQLIQNNWRNIVNSELSTNKTSYLLLLGKKLKSSKLIFSPNLLIDFSKDQNTLILLGLDISYKDLLSAGFLTKNDESLISCLKFNISENLKIIYAFEFTYSSSILNGTNSHEFMFSYHTSIVEKMKRSNLVSYF